MDVKFKWNKSQSQIERDLGFGRELNLFVAATAQKLMFDFVPSDSETLAKQAEVYATAQEGFVHYTSTYAHFQFMGLLMLAPNGSAWAGFGETKHYAEPAKDLVYGTDSHPLATSHWDRAMVASRGEKYARSINERRKRLAK